MLVFFVFSVYFELVKYLFYILEECNMFFLEMVKNFVELVYYVWFWVKVFI